MVLGVPDAAESTASPSRRQVDAVLFDFHGTLAQVEDPVAWVTAAAAACGTQLDRGRATILADRLVTAGRAGGPLPHRVPPQLAGVIRQSVSVQELTVQAAITGKRDYIYQAALMDPHTAAELSPDQIWHLVDDLIEAHGSLLPAYH